jgi:hypothetical protein
MTRRIEVVDTKTDAVGMYRTFMARNPTREVEMPWTWPTHMQEVGVGQAEMYRSNKWQKDLKKFDDYKHVAESPRLTYCRTDFLRDWGDPRRRIPIYGPTVEFQGPMPKHFTILAPLLGVQVHLFAGVGDDGRPFLEPDENIYEVRMDRAMLGGAMHPKTKDPFLFVYTEKGGVHMIITGERLKIKRDGIVG